MFETIRTVFVESVYFLPIFIIPGLLYAIRTYNKKRRVIKPPVVIQDDVLKINKEDGDDFLGLRELDNPVKFQKEAEEIIQRVNSGEEQVRVDFSKALYIIKNFKSYNIFSAEDGKILFEKLKEVIDEEENIKQSELKNKPVEREFVSVEKKNFEAAVEELEDGSIKVFNPKGYSILKDGVIIGYYDYEKEKKKLEEQKRQTVDAARNNELQLKIDSLESAIAGVILKSNLEEQENKSYELEEIIENIESKTNTAEKKEPRRKKSSSKEKTIKETTQKLNNDIGNLFDNFNEENKIAMPLEEKDVGIKKEIGMKKEKPIILDDEKQNEATAQEKPFLLKLKKLKSKHEVIKNTTLFYMLNNFLEEHLERKDEFLEWLLDYKNLFDTDEGILFIDMDIKKECLYVNAAFFTILFMKFYEAKDIEKICSINNSVLHGENIKKVLEKYNTLFAPIYKKAVFKFIGKGESPFMQKNVSYETDGKKIVSSQMIIIDLSIEHEYFSSKISEIKKNIVSKYRPKVYTTNVANREDYKDKIISVDLKYFQSCIDTV